MTELQLLENLKEVVKYMEVIIYDNSYIERT